ncbi:MAG: hypothetical protein HY898_04705 [Deltaproteobacteria bacterium]|nr:hypothetical protein [Deltaproteobacteria bacterium]
MSLRAATIALLVSIACGCGAATPQAAAPADNRSEVERYFPLIDRTIFTYQTSTGSSSTEMFMIRVKRVGPKVAQLLTGSSLRVLSIGPDSVRREGAGVVLRAPLKTGETWQGDKGTVRIVDANAEVRVPAGNYKNCVQTVEEVGGDARGKITTFFCPDVGIARMEVEEWHGAEHLTQIMELRSFGPPMDLGKQPPAP